MKIIKIAVLSIAVVAWVLSAIGLVGAIYGGHLMPWVAINVVSGIYTALVFYATDKEEKWKNTTN